MVEKRIWHKPLLLWFSLEKERKRESSVNHFKSDDSCSRQENGRANFSSFGTHQTRVNVKELQLINAEEASHLIVKQIKPNFKSLGQRLGKDMKTVAGEITNMTSEQISTH